jgi:predicted ATPase
VSEGLAELQRGVQGFRTSGAELNLPHFLSLLADVLGEDGRPAEALAAVDEALVVAQRNDDRMWEPCLHVQRAALLRALHRVEEAEDALRLAVAVAREQHARLPELRAATALARLTHGQECGAEARASLETLYRSFTHDVAQRDLADAAALLAELPAT